MSEQGACGLRAPDLMALIDRDLAMAADQIVHPATDPLAWIDSARLHLRTLQEVLSRDSDPDRTGTHAPTVVADSDDAVGLSIDMLDVDRLRQWANNLLVYGPDISQWGDHIWVASKMQIMATSIEHAVRDIGTLRKRVQSAYRVPTPRVEE